MDYHAFASLAHVKVLLLPVGSIKRNVFEKWAAEIRTFDNIRLGDIPADTRDERARFMPSPLSTGHLHLSFPSHPPPASLAPLSLFRSSSFPLGVIGIASCAQNDSLSSIQAQFNASVNELFPTESMYPLARSCFVFEKDDGSTNLNLGDSLPGLVVIPSMMGNKKLYIGTLLADVCSQILGEFATVVSRIESPLGNEYLNSTTFPLLPPESELPESLDKLNGTGCNSLPSINSQPELGSNSTAKKTPALALRRTSTMGPGSSPGTPTSRVSSLPVPPPKKRTGGIGAASSHGRLFKVLGDLFLLSGRTEDASVWYTEAIAVFKTSQDGLWHASVLEGLATISVLDAWSAGHGLQSSFSTGKEPWAELTEKLTQAITLYSKPPPSSDADQYAHLAANLYVSAVLRHTSLLFAIWSAKGWGPLAFTTMLQPGSSSYLPPTLADTESISYVNLERLTTMTGISRSQIAESLAQAHGPWLLHLSPRDQIAALEAMAGMYACLGYKRKEAYILREVLGCLMDLIVCGRDELMDSRSNGYANANANAGLGLQGVSFDGAKPGHERGAVGMRENESSEGNESILRLVKHVCKVHGIDLTAVNLVGSEPDKNSQRISSDSKAEKASSNEDELPVDVTPELYGWPELQVGIVREALAVAEALPDYPSVAQFSLSALKTLYPVLTAADQHHLYSTSARALATARRRGERRRVDYWSGSPIVSIELAPLPLARLPLEKRVSILQDKGDKSLLPGMTDPFLYNPRKSIAGGKGPVTVVQEEPIEIVVTLRNPFVFDLEIQSLTLSTSGVPIQTKPMVVTVPANSFHHVTVTAKPLESGILIIRGCVVQAPGGAPREFVLPLSTEEEEDKWLRRRSAIECESGRSKYAGLDSRPWEKRFKRTSQTTATPSLTKPSFRFLECRVVPIQPLLRIRRTSLAHGAVMLYNGETSSIRVTLENVSSMPIDFLRLTFDDSTIAPAQQALAEGELSVFETYETEYDLIHRPVMSWNSDKGPNEFPPGEKVTVNITSFGKVGCTSGTIHVSYAHVARRRESLQMPSEVFYTRQVSYPVLVTVYHMLECQGMDILPYRGIDASAVDCNSLEGERWHSTQCLLDVGDEVGWCLFSVEVRNTYGIPFEVTFERLQEGTAFASTSSLVPPGSTTRIAIPLKRFTLSDEHVSQPIPTLSDRQFVVTKSKLSSAEEKAQRELFWYREEVLKCIKGRWREGGGTRSGDLSLRGQRMSQPMMNTLRVETARVEMSLVQRNDEDDDSTEVIRKGFMCFLPRANEFVYLRTKVINQSPSPLLLTMDLTMEPAEHIIHQGALSRIPVGMLEPNESREVETSLCFVSCGSFDLAAELRSLEAPQDQNNRVGWAQLKAIVRSAA